MPAALEVPLVEVQEKKPSRGRRAKQQSEAPAAPGTPTPPAPEARPGRAERRLRESNSPGRFALGDSRKYKRFWRDAQWQAFLQPCPGGFEEARQKPATLEGTRAIQPTAG